MHRLDYLLGATAVTHGSAEDTNTAGHGAVIHIDVGPHLLQQFFSRHETIMVLDQIHEHLIRFAPQLDRLAYET
jgi:hypothetical protein